MEQQLVFNPIEWSTEINIIPSDISTLADATPFSCTHASKTILTATTIDGNSLKRLRVTANWVA